MIAVLEKSASLRTKAEIVRFLEQAGFRVQVSETPQGSFVSVVGEGAEAVADVLRRDAGGG